MFIMATLSDRPNTMWKPEGWRASEKQSSFMSLQISRVKVFVLPPYDQILTVRSFEQVAMIYFLMQTARPIILFEWKDEIMCWY
jgi:hypothetical protein